MSTHKHVDLICFVLIAAILASILALFVASGGTFGQTITKEYETGLFDTGTVHSMEISIDDWDGFLADCENEEYVMCDVTIDGETVQSVGIRAKGNTSLSSVKNYGNNRYSFKIEFDHYQDGINYQGLDKLSLNNIIQDNTYMKDYLCYQLMQEFGVTSPLCSYIYLTVNGEDWGLYLAVEAVEDSFLERNYGNSDGELYKPDSISVGGGPGAGDDVEMPSDFDPSEFDPSDFDPSDLPEGTPDAPDAQNGQDGQGGGPGENGGGPGGGMGSDDVKLIYSDDDPDSYSNIFDNAKTDVTEADEKRLIQSLKKLNAGEEIDQVVNTEEVLRYFVVHNFVCNYDSYTGMMVHNYYLYEKDGQLSMIPWDYNLAFGGFQGGGDGTSTINDPIDSPVSGGEVSERPMVAWIFQNETYTKQYHALYEKFVQYIQSSDFQTEYARVVELISPYVEKDPTKFCTYDEFKTGVDTLQNFCQLRAESVQGQLAGTIPSTTEGQKEDSSALIDGSSLNLSDMGSMDNGMGGPGGKGGPDGMTAPDDNMQTGETPKMSPKGTVDKKAGIG